MESQPTTLPRRRRVWSGLWTWHAPKVRERSDSGTTVREDGHRVLATRKPKLLFRFVGALLLRLEERTFDG